MSKYKALWEYVQNNESNTFKLTFEEIEQIAGIPIDHSFLKYKKELMEYGWQVGKISMKEMDEERRKVKRLIIILFLACLCAALVCFGIFIYLLNAYRNGELVGDRIVTVSKIVVMTGIFFLILAFGNLLPVFISHKKHG